MAYLVSKGGRLCSKGGRLVTSAGAAPCVCDFTPGCDQWRIEPPSQAAMTFTGLRIQCSVHPCTYLNNCGPVSFPFPCGCIPHVPPSAPNGTFVGDLINVVDEPDRLVLTYQYIDPAFKIGECWDYDFDNGDPCSGVPILPSCRQWGTFDEPLTVIGEIECNALPGGGYIVTANVGASNSQYAWGAAGIYSEQPFENVVGDGFADVDTCCFPNVADRVIPCYGNVSITPL